MDTKTLRRRICACQTLLLAVGLLMPARAAGADSLFCEERKLTKLAEGVYEIRHTDPFPGWVHGNTTVIIGEREVFVVDATQMSYSAREDIAQIREWTSKPVRYLLNTHWHQDHNGGNKDYLEAFPGLAILAHSATRDMMANTGPNLPREMLRDTTPAREKLRQRLDAGKADDGQALTEAQKAKTRERLAQLDRIIAEANRFSYQLPTLTFESELQIDLGNREVQVMHLGRGNTAGDALVYLPKEKILITGDLLVSPVPFAFDGYPAEWIETLERMERMDAGVIVPGHGEVMHDKAFLRVVLEGMKSIVAQVQEQLRGNDDAKLDEIKKALDLKSFREKIAGNDPGIGRFFDYSVGEKFVELAYYEAKQR